MIQATTWQCKPFAELTLSELYDVLKLRTEVFIIEQNCIYQDCDGKDEASWHLMGMVNGTLCAYARLLPPGLSYDTPSIGRVVTSPQYRNKGKGKELIEVAIKKIFDLFGHPAITISAQVYLEQFYTSFNFQSTGPIYLEDNIEHIKMKRSIIPTA